MFRTELLINLKQIKALTYSNRQDAADNLDEIMDADRLTVSVATPVPTTSQVRLLQVDTPGNLATGMATPSGKLQVASIRNSQY